MSETAKLTASEQAGLRDLYNFRHIPYRWKPAAMKKLAAKGLAEIISHLPPNAYRITDAGLRAIAALLPAVGVPGVQDDLPGLAAFHF